MENLVKQKEFLLIKMKDLLLVNDTYNLEKIKKEYDIIQKKLKHKFHINLKYENNEKDPYSNYSLTKLNGKVNPRHLKHYQNFKNPVKDYNYLVYEREIKEEFEDTEGTECLNTSKINFTYNPSSLDNKLKMKNNLDVSVQKTIKEGIKKLETVEPKVYNDLYGDVFIDHQEVLQYEPEVNEINEVNEIQQESYEADYNNEYY